VNVLTIIAHPNPQSFNYGIIERIEAGLKQAGHEIRRRDLHAPLFYPVLEAEELGALQRGKVADAVRNEQALLEWAEGLIFIYPLWWFDRPAVLKGWCDRVFTNGFAFTYDESGVAGLLQHKKALVLITAGGSEAEMQAMGSSSESILFPMTSGSLKFCGIEKVEGRVFYAVATVSDRERLKLLDTVEEMGRSF
jgi:NAD(P)H dehydrogenase (quinone)